MAATSNSTRTTQWMQTFGGRHAAGRACVVRCSASIRSLRRRACSRRPIARLPPIPRSRGKNLVPREALAAEVRGALGPRMPALGGCRSQVPSRRCSLGHGRKCSSHFPYRHQQGQRRMDVHRSKGCHRRKRRLPRQSFHHPERGQPRTGVLRPKGSQCRSRGFSRQPPGRLEQGQRRTDGHPKASRRNQPLQLTQARRRKPPNRS
mmetsp:Transcript_57766/g.161129  ORF Transcript_57766/g.161129 Transcript_57766/m.161129 type:complete len:206 (-) Transcript_57766:1053-1670(-)